MSNSNVLHQLYLNDELILDEITDKHINNARHTAFLGRAVVYKFFEDRELTDYVHEMVRELATQVRVFEKFSQKTLTKDKYTLRYDATEQSQWSNIHTK